MQGEISYHLNKEVLDLSLFEGLTKNSLKYLGKGIENQFAGPNEYLIHKDDPLDTIWYISSGSMEVMDGDMVVAILGKYGYVFYRNISFLIQDREIWLEVIWSMK